MGRFHERLHSPVTWETVLVVLITVSSLAVNAVLSIKLLQSRAHANQLENRVKMSREQYAVDTQTVDFLSLFVDTILVAGKEISFEDRLDLENKVRAIGDDEVLARWTAFTHAKNDAQAQIEVRHLLNLIAARLNGK